MVLLYIWNQTLQPLKFATKTQRKTKNIEKSYLYTEHKNSELINFSQIGKRSQINLKYFI